jgi:polar amino acid transport system permease protein
MDWSVVVDSAPELARGLVQSLWLCAVAAVLALVLGAGLTGVQMRSHGVVRRLAEAYTALCLGLPLLIVIYVLFYALPEYGVTLSPHTVGVAALALYYAPYFAQVMGAAVKSISPGQWDAATALGMPAWHCLRRIVLPQALPMALPPMTGLLIGLLKDSALLAVVSVPEFMFAARQAIADTYAPLEIYLAVALVYWVLSTACAAVADAIERRLTAYRRAVPGAATTP